jgi:hypothetical protein
MTKSCIPRFNSSILENLAKKWPFYSALVSFLENGRLKVEGISDILFNTSGYYKIYELSGGA